MKPQKLWASGNKEHLVEELGDVLLQVVLNAQILSEKVILVLTML